MDQTATSIVWVFHAEGAQFASAVFSTRARAEEWIANHELTGILTAYPVDVSAYDYALAKGSFRPSRPHHGTPEHVGRFANAEIDHVHYRDGREGGIDPP